MSEIRAWFAEQPFSTKWIGVASLSIPLLMKFYILPAHWLVWHWESIAQKYQIWRMLTAPFLTRVNFNFIFSLYFRFTYSLYLETGYFSGRPADYAYFIIIILGLINAGNYFVQSAVLWESFSMAIIYLWAMTNRQVVVNFMLGFKFPAMYLPIALLGLDFLMTGELWGGLIGMLAGHAYYFLAEIYSQRDPRWRARLTAPRWLAAMLPAGPRSTIAAGSHPQGFSVQRPEQSFGGKGNYGADTSKGNTSAFTPFGGKAQRLGQQ
jgi:hypothetical protein